MKSHTEKQNQIIVFLHPATPFLSDVSHHCHISLQHDASNLITPIPQFLKFQFTNFLLQ